MWYPVFWELNSMQENDKMKNERSRTIDIAKGIAIFLVVMGHLIQYTLAPTGRDFFQNPVFKIIYSFHMPLFMFVSGYLSAYSLRKRTLKENYNNKVRGLLIPYALWTLLTFIVIVSLKVVRGEAVGIINSAKSLITLSIISPYIWFLSTLFIFYCLLFFTKFLEDRIGKVALVIPLVLVLMVPIKNYFGVYLIQFFYPFFLVGYLVNRYILNQGKLKVLSSNKFMMFVGSLVLFLVLVSQWERSDYIYVNLMSLSENQIFAQIMRYLYRYAVGFLGIIVVFFISDYIARFKVTNFLQLLGTYTMDIYLIQNILVSVLYKEAVEAFGSINNITGFPLIVYCLFITIVTVILCIWISRTFIREDESLKLWLLGSS